MNASTLLSLEQSRHTVAAVTGYLENLNARTQLVALALLAESHSPYHGNGVDPDHPMLETVRVTGEALARYNAVADEFPLLADGGGGIQPHMEELRAANFDLFEFDDHSGDFAVPSPRPRNGDKLFDIVRVREWGDPHRWNLSSVAWLVRAGQWAYWSMNEAGRVLLCRIASASLSHRDPDTRSLTLRLGQRVGFMTLLETRGREAAVTVEHILDATGELSKDKMRNAAWHGTMYKRFSLALFSLCSHGAVNDVTWPAEYRFDGLHGNGAAPEGWMTSSIKFMPPVIPGPQNIAASHRAMNEMKI